MADNIAKPQETGTVQQSRDRRWQVAGWIAFGILLGVVLAALFFAYGQPGLLLEQMNLRYCG